MYVFKGLAVSVSLSSCKHSPQVPYSGEVHWSQAGFWLSVQLMYFTQGIPCIPPDDCLCCWRDRCGCLPIVRHQGHLITLMGRHDQKNEKDKHKHNEIWNDNGCLPSGLHQRQCHNTNNKISVSLSKINLWVTLVWFCEKLFGFKFITCVLCVGSRGPGTIFIGPMGYDHWVMMSVRPSLRDAHNFE